MGQRCSWDGALDAASGLQSFKYYQGGAQGRLSDSWIVKWSGSGSKKAHGTVIEMQSISRVFGLIIAGLLLLKESRTGVYSQFIVSGGKGGVGRGE